MNRRDVNKLRTQIRKIEDVIENLTTFNMDIYEQIDELTDDTNDDTIIDELNIVTDIIDVAINQIELGKEELEEIVFNEN